VGKTNLQAGLFSKSGTAQAYRVIVEKHGRATPRKLGSCSHREWVLMLGEAHYVRYDETTAARLLSLGKKLRPCRRFRAPRPALYPTCEALKSHPRYELTLLVPLRGKTQKAPMTTACRKSTNTST